MVGGSPVSRAITSLPMSIVAWHRAWRAPATPNFPDTWAPLHEGPGLQTLTACSR